ncbi:MAG: hypothetical protein IKX22_10950 [Prevotella sp.]|nr:hypothetical protein [Prevotella sp.]
MARHWQKMLSRFSVLFDEYPDLTDTTQCFYGAKIVQVERKAKKKTKFFLSFPKRRLSYGKIVQTEKSKEKNEVFSFFSETPPILWKDSANSEKQRKKRSFFFLFRNAAYLRNAGLFYVKLQQIRLTVIEY